MAASSVRCTADADSARAAVASCRRVGRACAGERVQRSFVDTLVPRPGDCQALIYSWSSRPHPSGVVRWCVSLSRASSSSSSSASLPSYSSCPLLLLLRSAPPRRHRVLFVALAPPWTAAARSCLWPPSPSTRLSDLWRVSTPWPACLSVAHSPPAVAATVACAHAPTLASFSARRPRDSIPPPPLPPPPVAWRAHAQHHDLLALTPTAEAGLARTHTPTTPLAVLTGCLFRSRTTP